MYKQKSLHQCNNTKHRVETDTSGQFRFKGNKDFRLFYQFGDPIETWGICIIHLGKQYNGWTAQGIGNTPSEIALNCELAKNNEEMNETMFVDGFGICQINIK